MLDKTRKLVISPKKNINYQKHFYKKPPFFYNFGRYEIFQIDHFSFQNLAFSVNQHAMSEKTIVFQLYAIFPICSYQSPLDFC